MNWFYVLTKILTNKEKVLSFQNRYKMVEPKKKLGKLTQN